MSDKERITLKSHPALIFYLIGLGMIVLVILWLTITFWNLGLYFISFWGFLAFWSIPLAFILPLFLPAYGAYSRKKWGLIVNYIFLGFLIPVFIVFPLVMSWYIPHIEDVYPVNLIIAAGILIAIFDIYYLVWMIQNRRIFT